MVSQKTKMQNRVSRPSGRGGLLSSPLVKSRQVETMRMRLRAPDEPEAESGYDGDGTPSTPERGHALPPLDVGSPEYIEERLENLKRRPNWGTSWTNTCGTTRTATASEFGDLECVSAAADVPGFVRSTLWSLLVVAFAPLLVVLSPCLRHNGYG